MRDEKTGHLSTETNTVRVRGMVCARCIESVVTELDRLGIPVAGVQLGVVTLQNSVTPGDRSRIEQALQQQGFSLLPAAPPSVHQRVQAFVDAYFRQDDVSETTTRLSAQLQELLGLDYSTLSRHFTRDEGETLEKFIINRRIDKVKEQMVYSDDTLTEIAHRTGYSSVQHLSNQFRQRTGLTPSFFRQIRYQKQALQQQTASAPQISQPGERIL